MLTYLSEKRLTCGTVEVSTLPLFPTDISTRQGQQTYKTERYVDLFTAGNNVELFLIPICDFILV